MKLDEALVDLDEPLVDLDEALVDLDDTLVNLDEALVNLDEALVDRDEALVKLGDTLVDLDDALVDLDDALVDLDEALGDLDEALGDLDETLGDLDEALVKLGDTLVDLDETLVKPGDALVDLDETLVKRDASRGVVLRGSVDFEDKHAKNPVCVRRGVRANGSKVGPGLLVKRHVMSEITLLLEVVLDLPHTHKDLLAFAKVVDQSMTGNARFAAPSPPLSTLQGAIGVYDATITARGPGAGPARREARAALIMILRHLRDYVQGVAEAAMPEAASVVAGANMRLRKSRARDKAPFAVQQGDVSGLVLLIARAVARQATYYWFWSLDQASWTSLPDTLIAKTTAGGLTPGQTYYFRFRALSRAGLGDFSQILRILVK